MDHGFEFVAAKPKRAVEDEPHAENMRGDRKVTKNPSTDQKKVRRAQQRKTASDDLLSAIAKQSQRVLDTPEGEL